jgi:hypothetical protein
MGEESDAARPPRVGAKDLANEGAPPARSKSLRVQSGFSSSGREAASSFFVAMALGLLMEEIKPIYRPADRLAAITVFAISMAMVIRPTPPGTGVIAPATEAASA